MAGYPGQTSPRGKVRCRPITYATATAPVARPSWPDWPAGQHCRLCDWESSYPSEVFRILQPGGSFLTQQVGGAHNQRLNQLLGAPPGYDLRWDLAFAARQLEAAGFLIQDRREAFPQTIFTDVGALVYYLKAVPWQIPGFSIDSYRDRLHAIHQRIQADGPLRIQRHFFYLAAVKR